MNSTRERILNRLRQTAIDAPDGLDRPVERHDWSREERITRFSERMRAVRAEVHDCGRVEWPRTLLKLARDKGMQNLLYAPQTGHGQALAAARADQDPELVPYADSIEVCKDRLFDDLQGSVTATRGGIAETGSLILWPDVQEPRLMSLVPPIHFALLDADRIHSTFAEAVACDEWAAGMPGNALLISGPSKSADIEQTLAYGVHGPKELVVILMR